MSEQVERVLDQLPVFPDIAPESEWRSLRVYGLVATPLTLSRDDLTTLVQRELTDDFRCVEGWVVRDQHWEGILVATLLDMAGPLAETAYVAFSAGGYTVGMTLAEALENHVIVALRLNGEWLPPEHGGPCRLMAQGKIAIPASSGWTAFNSWPSLPQRQAWPSPRPATQAASRSESEVSERRRRSRSHPRATHRGLHQAHGETARD